MIIFFLSGSLHCCVTLIFCQVMVLLRFPAAAVFISFRAIVTHFLLVEW